MKKKSNKALARELAQTLINLKRFGIQRHHDLDIRQSEFMMLSSYIKFNYRSFKGR